MKATDQKHEIIATRKGGFGGSDAKMFYKVGQKGIEALSDTFVSAPKDERSIEGLLPHEQSAVVKMRNILSEIKRMEEEAEKKARLLAATCRHRESS